VDHRPRVTWEDPLDHEPVIYSTGGKVTKKNVAETAADATRSAATHAAETIEQLAEAVAPLIEAAMAKAATAKDHVAPYAATAMEKVAPLAESAREHVAPLAESAKGHVVPLAQQTREHVAPLAQQAMDKVTPLAESARVHVGHAGEQFAPLATAALDKGMDLASHTRDSLEPAIHEAYQHIQDDLMPKLNDLIHSAVDNPVVTEATHRGQAAFAALKGEVVVPPAEASKGSAAARLAKILAVGAVVGGAIVALRQLLASRDTGWTAHQPSAAYVNRDDEDSVPQPVAAEVVADEPVVEEPEVDEPEVATTEALHHGDSHAPVDEDEAQALMTDEGAPVVEVADETTAEGEPDENPMASVFANPYGDGAYVGDEPPEGYTIKGNERSMKYHLAESGGYEPTIADVWFASEEAATEAGFTRAQR